jgi:hypothetical protein
MRKKAMRTTMIMMKQRAAPSSGKVAITQWTVVLG